MIETLWNFFRLYTADADYLPDFWLTISKSAFPPYPINLLIFKSMQLILFSSVCCGIYKDCVPVKQGILQVERILSLFAQSLVLAKLSVWVRISACYVFSQPLLELFSFGLNSLRRKACSTGRKSGQSGAWGGPNERIGKSQRDIPHIEEKVKHHKRTEAMPLLEVRL